MILAPMQGLTEVLFRRCFEQCFPGTIQSSVSPFLSLTHGKLTDAGNRLSDVLPANNINSIPVIPQILGKECDEFVEMATSLYELGYNEVNWNIGCPVRRVAGKHRGSGILPYPDEIEKILNHVTPRIPNKLSIKMRLGYLNPNEIFKIIPILNSFPIASVTIHPRIGKQQYGGTPDLDTFGKVLPLVQHPVIYNGDICTREQYHHIRKRFPEISDVMIGRGILYNPLLPSLIKGDNPSSTRIATFITTLINAITNEPLSEQGKTRKIKEYWCLLYNSVSITQHQAQQILRQDSLNNILTEIHNIIYNLT